MWNKLAVLALILAATETARACNPEFPNLVIGKTDAGMLAAPLADFQHELSRIAPVADAGFKAVPAQEAPQFAWTVAVSAEQQTDDQDIAELKAVLPRGTASDKVVSSLQAWRSAVRKDAANAGPPPAGLPEEFALYERGAQLYHLQDFAGAREQWTRLLALPEKSRHARTVWAAYMIARTYSDADPAAAARGFAQVRALAKAGFSDSIGLAAASLGWEGRAQWQLKNWDAAIDLFLQQLRTGDEIAPWSLRDLAVEYLSSDDRRLASAVQNPAARQVITAYLVSQGGPYYTSRAKDIEKKSQRWLAAVTAAAPRDLRGADRMAWIAYQSGDIAAADRWLRAGGKEGEETAVGQWIRAKLWMRAGQIEKAAVCLANAARAFPQNEEWTDAARGWSGDLPWRPAAHAAGELAALQLGRGQFVDALDLLYRNGFWADSAYIAERVLTADELKAYVDKNFPAHDPGNNQMIYNWETGKPEPAKADDHGIRALLARRLTRLGRWKEARTYFPADLQPVLDQYITAIRDGHDAKKPAGDRAAALWTAAKLARARGMELLGTELAPDGAVTGGNYEEEPLLGRLDILKQQRTHTIAPFSPEEQKRVSATSEVVPEKRWHYRYVACDHAWEAAQLMPDNTDELAKLLIEAGGWVSAKDPQAADRFYKALVSRCAGTSLGRQAAAQKWFPSSK